MDSFNDAEFIEKINKLVGDKNLNEEKQSKIDIVLIKAEIEKYNKAKSLLELPSSIKNKQNCVKIIQACKETVEQGYEEYDNKIVDNMNRAAQIAQELSNVESVISAFQNKKKKQKDDEQEIKDLKGKYTVYQHLRDAFHADGMQTFIIKRKIKDINDNVAELLGNMVKFKVFLEYNDDKLDVMLEHTGEEARPIETGSGAEKALAALAIRFAFIAVSVLPKSDLLILDEPANEFDDEIRSGFTQLLKIAKSNFRLILMISHINSLADITTEQIEIQNKNNFAYVDV
jgi:DNA repair exonuclease SbcCD ATPase subunit